MSLPLERGLPKLVPTKQAGQRWTRIDAQHPGDNDGLEGEVTRSKAEVGVTGNGWLGMINGDI